jgi:hypothetical protein
MKMVDVFQLKYGDLVVDYHALPEASKYALAKYGASHYFGNMQSSKMVTRIVKAMVGTGIDDIKVWRAANADKVTEWTKEHLASALADLNNGTVGQRTGGGGGPRKDPVETKFAQLVVKDIEAVLKASANPGLVKLFRKAKAGESIDFGGGFVRTRQQMIDATVSQHGDRLRKDAEKLVRDEFRLAEKSAAGITADMVTPESLGF